MSSPCQSGHNWQHACRIGILLNNETIGTVLCSRHVRPGQRPEHNWEQFIIFVSPPVTCVLYTLFYKISWPFTSSHHDGKNATKHIAAYCSYQIYIQRTYTLYTLFIAPLYLAKIEVYVKCMHYAANLGIFMSLWTTLRTLQIHALFHYISVLIHYISV